MLGSSSPDAFNCLMVSVTGKIGFVYNLFIFTF